MSLYFLNLQRIGNTIDPKNIIICLIAFLIPSSLRMVRNARIGRNVSLWIRHNAQEFLVREFLLDDLRWRLAATGRSLLSDYIIEVMLSAWEIMCYPLFDLRLFFDVLTSLTQDTCERRGGSKSLDLRR